MNDKNISKQHKTITFKCVEKYCEFFILANKTLPSLKYVLITCLKNEKGNTGLALKKERLKCI